MNCPKCGYGPHAAEDATCTRCGLVFAKWREHEDARVLPMPGRVVETVADVPPGVLDGDGRRAVLFGVPAGLVLFALPFTRLVIGYLSILVHEFGHTVVAWMFGYPAIPAFDFVYGGGVTMTECRNTGLLIALTAGWLALFWLFRRNRVTLVVLAAVALVWVWLAATWRHDLVHQGAGHGAELVFAALFLSRALSGSGCHTSAERPVYAAAGTFLALKVAGLAWQLRTDADFRAEYEAAKGGGGWMDLSLIAPAFRTDVPAVAGVLLFAALLTPVIAWLMFRAQRPLRAGLERLLAR